MTPRRSSVTKETAGLLKTFARVIFLFYVPAIVVLTVVHFPYDTDPSINASSSIALASSSASESKRRSAAYYEIAYRADVQEKRGLDYEETARNAAKTFDIEGQVRRFVKDHNLQDKRVLEVGSGRGYLQDMVHDYTGLDIASEVASHYHKRFVVGSATNMPFPDNSFDAIWSVWVMEHIAEPERALVEMRRVLKPGGILFLYVAWDCQSWLADGFAVRPYSDFNWRGKLVKASLSVRSSPLFTISYLLPTRAVRRVQYAWSGNQTRLHFTKLDPNYEVYWQPDSDAAISLDGYETYLWFGSRGDKCLNCGTSTEELTRAQVPLIIRVEKPPIDRAGTTPHPNVARS
jgi:SAM-dependent methyltransferase